MSQPSKPIESSDGQKSIVQSPAEITFENVSFRYPNSDRWTLKNINFTIRKGDRISIVGRNGAGKSTVVKLLCSHSSEDSIFRSRYLMYGILLKLCCNKGHFCRECVVLPEFTGQGKCTFDYVE